MHYELDQGRPFKGIVLDLAYHKVNRAFYEEQRLSTKRALRDVCVNVRHLYHTNSRDEIQLHFYGACLIVILSKPELRGGSCDACADSFY